MLYLEFKEAANQPDGQLKLDLKVWNGGIHYSQQQGD